MDRFTVSLEEDLLRQFDELIRRRGYRNRSEAVRDILRDRLEAERLAQDDAPSCVACLSYIYNHHMRELARRLTRIQHGHHDLIRSTLHIHLDHDNCLEVSLLEGSTQEVRAFADAVVSETGVRHGRLNLVPVDLAVTDAHHHGHESDDHRPHVHAIPRT